MLSQGSVVQGRNAAKEVGSSREECCHRVQLYRGGMLPQGLEQHKGKMLTQLGNTGSREDCLYTESSSTRMSASTGIK
jgi:hypothetical protein